jgi:uncharacterized membrane protein
MGTLANTQTQDEAPAGAKLARGMGWFGIALGVAEISAPNALTYAIGLCPDRRSAWVMRAMGVREILHGVGILMRPRRPIPIWTRVAGDIVDLALLVTAATTRRWSTPRAAGAIAAVAGAAVLDIVASRRVQRAYNTSNRPSTFAVTINRSPGEVYSFLRDFKRLPQFMHYLDKVQETGPTTSHWIANLPLGGKVAWDAEIIQDRPGELIEWRSVRGSKIMTRGRVRFVTPPGRDNMTEVHVEMQLGGSGVGPSAMLADYFAKPQLKGDLRRLKQVIETGEVLASDASIHKLPHPAQPPAQLERGVR